MQLRNRVLKDPPKREVMNSYQLFQKQEYQKAKQGKPLKAGEQMKIIGKLWKELSDDRREYYDKLFEEAEHKYQQELILHYGGSESDCKQYKTFAQISPKPKKPVNPCLAYISSKRKQLKIEHPKYSFAQLQKRLVMEYRSLSNIEKQPYIEEYEKKLQFYQVNLEDWKKKYPEKQSLINTFVQSKYKRVDTNTQYQEKKTIRIQIKQPKKMTQTPQNNQHQNKSCAQKIKIVVKTKLSHQEKQQSESRAKQKSNKARSNSLTYLNKYITEDENTDNSTRLNQSTVNLSAINQVSVNTTQLDISKYSFTAREVRTRHIAQLRPRIIKDSKIHLNQQLISEDNKQMSHQYLKQGKEVQKKNNTIIKGLKIPKSKSQTKIDFPIKKSEMI